MGVGIAVTCLAAGHEVLLVEQDVARVELASEAVRASGERLAAKREDLDVDAVLQRLACATDLAETPGSEMVIEAVPENLELKREIFARLDSLHGTNVLLASNTSSLSIDAISAGLAHPGRIIGAHFFNPVPVSALVEVVVGERTADDTVARLLEFVTAIGKTPIVVADSPGFASSRLGLALGLEAIRMVEQGVGSIEDIDTAMELGYRHPMGPLRLTDLVGLDVRLAIAEHLHAELGEQFAPPRVLVDMVENGRLGKKAGRGFYEW